MKVAALEEDIVQPNEQRWSNQVDFNGLHLLADGVRQEKLMAAVGLP
jgi:hypothetical protein